MRTLLWFTAAFASAVLAYVYLWQDSCVLWITLGSGLIAAAWVLLRLPKAEKAAVLGLGLCAGVLYCFLYGALFLPNVDALTERTITVSVRVLSRSRETDYGCACEGDLQLADGTCRVMLYTNSLEQVPQAGDLVTCQAYIVRTGTRLLEGDSLYLRSSGAVLCLYAQSALIIEKGTPGWSEQAGIWLQTKIDELYDGETAGLLRALLTGDRSGLTHHTRSQMASAGVSHCIAVSGMHVSMLLLLVTWFCGGQPVLRSVIGLPLAVFFAFLTGGSPSVVRAVVMQVLMLGAVLVKREYDPPTGLAAAVLFLLLGDPWVAADVGFQLSVLAVAGLLLFSGRIQTRMLKLVKKPGRIYRWFVSGIGATFGATALTNPLTALYFKQLSLAAPLTNLLILWAVTGMFVLGLLSCLLGPVGKLLVFVTESLAEYILAVCRGISRFPYAAAEAGTALIIWGLCAYVIVLVLLLRPKIRPAIPSCLLAASFCICILVSRYDFVRGDMAFTALDVGQGQCLLLESQGFTAMVDCGGDEGTDTGETAAGYLMSRGQTRLNMLILTHYDWDHVSGVVQLLHRIRVDRLVMPGQTEENGIRAAIEAAAAAEGTEVIIPSDRMEIDFSGGNLTVFPPVSAKNENDSGICVLATAAEYDILITGDLSQAAEQKLLQTGVVPDVDLLVAGHHGSEDSTSYALLTAASPEVVLISVGKDNPHGHPSQQTLTRIAQYGIPILRTDEQGTVVIRK